jgi:phosphoglycerate dehydrogenase-like enzyme
LKIVVVDHVYLEQQHIARLRSLGEVEIFSDPASSDQELLRRIRGAEIVIVGWSHMTKDVIDSAPNLRMIAIWATTCHYADLEAARRRGIVVTHVPAYSTEAVAEHSFALLLATVRKLRLADIHVREGKFDWRPFAGMELAEKTLGLVGTGAIGFRVAELARAFRMRLLGFDKVHNMKKAREIGLQYVDLQTLLKESDIISIHVTLTPETIGLIGKSEIDKMKRGAVLINTSQGKVVDQQALADALKSRRLSYAGLDVFAEEPPARDNPLFGLDNTQLSPHIGFHTAEAKVRCTDICIENVARFVEGRPENICEVS